ncbi:hypothetical protein D6810_02360 [Candidatus Dojkabacteria bacterium]|uniref:Uncharacterized protein n=1 Tax=Candidatus Dojkabacteria bacterium TaxID=2099670 RepID=A0A3M0Z4C6_9BACT|nr:MAG: hypothetical protein D6810_02360 [Candidatus Dojkabacteria bacterium]
MNKNKFLIFASIAGVLVGVVVVGVFVLGVTVQDKSVKTLRLSVEEKMEVYKKILSQSSSSILTVQRSIGSMTSRVASPEAESQRLGTYKMVPNFMVPTPPLQQSDVDYDKESNLSKTVTTVTRGPKYNACRAVYDPENMFSDAKNTNLYYSGDNEYINKVESKDEKDRLIDYTITRSSVGGSSEVLSYKGGRYAVRMIYPPVPVQDRSKIAQPEPYVDSTSGPSNSVSVPESNDFSLENENDKTKGDYDPLEELKRMYGQDIDIVEKRFIDGVEVYVLRYSYEINCDSQLWYAYQSEVGSTDTTRSRANISKIYQEVFLNVKTFTHKGQVSYIDAVSPSNVIVSYKFEFDNLKISDDEVKKFFDFNVDYPGIQIKEFRIPVHDPAKQVQEQLNYYNSLQFKFIRPSGTDYEIQSAYFYDLRDSVSSTDFYNDRDFYALGEFGDKMYELHRTDNKKRFIQPTGSYTISKSNGENVFTFQIYSSSSIDDILKLNFSSEDSYIRRETEKVKLTISGQSIDAVKVTEKYVYNVSDSPIYRGSDSTTNQSPSENGSYKFVLFKYEEYVYQVHVYSDFSKNPDPTSFTYSAFNKGSKEFTQLDEAVKRILQNV